MGNAEANRAYVSTVSSAYDAIAVIDGGHRQHRPGTAGARVSDLDTSLTTSTCTSAEMALVVLTLRCWTRRRAH